MLFSTPQDNVLKLSIVSTKRNKRIGKKGAMSQRMADTVHILGSQNFGNSGRLYPVERTIDSNKITRTLSSYEKYKFRFIIESLLFTTNLQNNTDRIL